MDMSISCTMVSASAAPVIQFGVDARWNSQAGPSAVPREMLASRTACASLASLAARAVGTAKRVSDVMSTAAL